MARIVVVSGSVGSIQRPNAEVARRLTQLGHTVTFVSTPDFEARAAEIGIDFVGTTSARRIDPLEPMPESSWRQRLRATRERRRAVVDALHDEEVVRIVAGLSPDLVLIEIELVAQLMAIHARSIPVAALTIFPYPFADRQMPALHTAAIPGTGRSGTDVAIWARWLKYRLGLRVDLGRQLIRSPGDHLRRQYRGLAKRLGVSPKELDFGQWVQPLVLKSVPVVSMTPPAFDFPHDPRPELFDIGVMLLDSAPDGGADAFESGFVAKDQREGRRLIYASFGAFARVDDAQFIERLGAAVANRPEWDLVVGLGGRLDLNSFGTLPPNVRLMSWAPQREILEVAAVAVIHGGYSSVHECIRARVPMLFHPFGIDQPGNAARSVHHGLGIIGDRVNDTPATIEAHIDQLISDERYRKSLDAMAALVAPSDDSALIAAIDALLSRAQR